MSTRNSSPNAEEEQPVIVSQDDEFPVDRLKAKVNESLGSRSLTVYLVLFAGAATLLLLLGIVWISATGGGDEDELICTEVSPTDARLAVLAGEVERINILVDGDNPTDSLTGIQLRYADDSCRQTPQGADIRNELFSIIGAVDLYNNYSDSAVSVHYQAQAIQQELLSTSTPVPTQTAIPSETPVPELTATAEVPTEAPTESPTRAAVETPTNPPSLPSPDTSTDLPVGDAGA